MAPTKEYHGGHSRTLQTRGETRRQGGVSVSCLASRTSHECPRHNKGYIWRLDTWCGPILYRKCHSHNTPRKRHNNTWVEPIAGYQKRIRLPLVDDYFDAIDPELYSHSCAMQLCLLNMYKMSKWHICINVGTIQYLGFNVCGKGWLIFKLADYYMVMMSLQNV